MKYFIQKSKGILLLTAVSLGLISCNIEELPDFSKTYLPNYEGEIALLLVEDTVSFRDFLEDAISDSTAYEITEEQRIVFSYDISSEFSLGEDFIEIEGINKVEDVATPVKAAFTAIKDTSFIIVDRVFFDYPASKDEQMDSMYYSNAEIEFTLLSSFPGLVKYHFESSSFVHRLTGELVEVNDSVNLKTSETPSLGIVSKNEDISLNYYKTLLESDGDSNKFFVDIEAEVFLEAGDVIEGDEKLQIGSKIESPEFQAIFGYFGKDTFDIEETRVDLDFFEDLGGTGIVFESPEIDFTVDNKFGLPVSVDFSQVYAYFEGGDTLYFSGSFPDEFQLMEATPVENYGEITTTHWNINAENSNVRDLLTGSPEGLVFPFIGYTNFGPDSTQNWLTDSSNINYNAKFSIPFSFRMEGFEYSQVEEMDDLSALEGTKEIELLFNTINEFPLDGRLDLYMLDSDSVAIDSLVNAVLFSAPTEFDANGRVSTPGESIETVVLDEALVNSLIAANSLKIVVKLDSYNASQGDFVEVFADYTLQVKMGIAGELSIDLNGN